MSSRTQPMTTDRSKPQNSWLSNSMITWWARPSGLVLSTTPAHRISSNLRPGGTNRIGLLSGAESLNTYLPVSCMVPISELVGDEDPSIIYSWDIHPRAFFRYSTPKPTKSHIIRTPHTPASDHLTQDSLDHRIVFKCLCREYIFNEHSRESSVFSERKKRIHFHIDISVISTSCRTSTPNKPSLPFLPRSIWDLGRRDKIWWDPCLAPGETNRTIVLVRSKRCGGAAGDPIGDPY